MTTDRANCPAPRHGDASAYSWWRCRCPDAREDHRLTSKRRREGRAQSKFVDGTGTARRLQALVAIGYGWSAIGTHLGVTVQRVARLATQTNPQIHVTTAKRIRDLFETLSATPAPESFASKKARNAARRRGYLPPLAWGDDIDDPDAAPNLGNTDDDIVDPVAIHQVLAGRLPFKQLRPAEQIALFADHTADWTPTRLAERLHMSTSSVARWRAKACPEPDQAAA